MTDKNIQRETSKKDRKSSKRRKNRSVLTDTNKPSHHNHHLIPVSKKPSEDSSEDDFLEKDHYLNPSQGLKVIDLSRVHNEFEGEEIENVANYNYSKSERNCRRQTDLRASRKGIRMQVNVRRRSESDRYTTKLKKSLPNYDNQLVAKLQKQDTPETIDFLIVSSEEAHPLSNSNHSQTLKQALNLGTPSSLSSLVTSHMEMSVEEQGGYAGEEGEKELAWNKIKEEGGRMDFPMLSRPTKVTIKEDDEEEVQVDRELALLITKLVEKRKKREKMKTKFDKSKSDVLIGDLQAQLKSYLLDQSSRKTNKTKCDEFTEKIEEHEKEISTLQATHSSLERQNKILQNKIQDLKKITYVLSLTAQYSLEQMEKTQSFCEFVESQLDDRLLQAYDTLLKRQPLVEAYTQDSPAPYRKKKNTNFTKSSTRSVESVLLDRPDPRLSVPPILLGLMGIEDNYHPPIASPLSSTLPPNATLQPSTPNFSSPFSSSATPPYIYSNTTPTFVGSVASSPLAVTPVPTPSFIQSDVRNVENSSEMNEISMSKGGEINEGIVTDVSDAFYADEKELSDSFEDDSDYG